jgi:hypothetical protein
MEDKMGEVVSNTFKSSEDFSRWFKLAAGDLDISASQLIRACVMQSLPMLRSHPDLIPILDHKARSPQAHLSNTGSRGNAGGGVTGVTP